MYLIRCLLQAYLTEKSGCPPAPSLRAADPSGRPVVGSKHFSNGLINFTLSASRNCIDACLKICNASTIPLCLSSMCCNEGLVTSHVHRPLLQSVTHESTVCIMVVQASSSGAAETDRTGIRSERPCPCFASRSFSDRRNVVFRFFWSDSESSFACAASMSLTVD